MSEIRRDQAGEIKESLLIKGNNLLALHCLKHQFMGRVKLIYIDPPYNTGNDSFKYNDNFNVASWLTFMRNRLSVAKELLTQDGVLFVQIGDRLESHMRLLLDEIFGEENFINRITVKTRSPSRFQTVNLGVFEVAEYILFYGKNKPMWKYVPQYVPCEYDRNYSLVMLNRQDNHDKWKYEIIADVVAKQLGYSDVKTAKKNVGDLSFYTMIADYALKNLHSVFRLTEIGNDAGKETVETRDVSKKTRGKIFVVKRVNNNDRYILDGKEITFYEKKVKSIDGKLTPTIMLTNMWTDISWEGIAKEGGVRLSKGKKPEQLVRRIIEMSTSPGELVLDFFLGSGTTSAVAHKLGRRFIGIEQLEYGDNDSLIRMKNVINGEQSGISKKVGWHGGGDFVYCELFKYNESYIDKVYLAKTPDELIDIWKDISTNSFLNWYINPEVPKDALGDFIEISKSDNGAEKQKKLLCELLNKNQLYINLSEIEDAKFSVNEQDKELNKQFYEDVYNA